MPKNIIKAFTPKSSFAWFIVLWCAGLLSCFMLSYGIKLLLPKIPEKSVRVIANENGVRRDRSS